MPRLFGKIAIITGSTKGIGLEIARRLGLQGTKVIISSRREENVDEAVRSLESQGIKVRGLVCHAASAKDRQKLLAEAEKLGGLDIVISNAAVNPAPGLAVFDVTESQWDKVFDVNVKAAFLLAKEAYPLLRKSSSGRIIIMSSASGYHGIKDMGAYSVSKATLYGLTKALSMQLLKEKITVNCIAPGPVATRFLSGYTDSEEKLANIFKLIPMKRFGLVEEVSALASFLCSEEAGYISGEIIPLVGGGQTRL